MDRKQFLVIGLFGVLMSGCVSNITVRKPILFEGNTGKLPLTVGVFIQDDIQNRKDKSKAIRYWLGDSLDRNIENALGRVFTNVQRLSSLENISNDIDRVAVITFGPKTKVFTPLTIFGDVNVVFDVECSIKTGEKQLWNGSGFGEAKKSLGTSLIFRWLFYSITENTMRVSLQESLDSLVESMLKDNQIILAK